MIAYAAGGALDTVIPGETGVLFAEQSVTAIIQAVESFDPDVLSSSRIRRHAEQFDSGIFEEKMSAFVEQKVAEKSS